MILPSGVKDLAAQRLFATRADFDGQRKRRKENKSHKHKYSNEATHELVNV